MTKLLKIVTAVSISLILSCGDSQVSSSGGSSVDVVGIGGWVRGEAITVDSSPVIQGTARLVNTRTLKTAAMDLTTELGTFSLTVREPGNFGVVLYDSLENGFYSSVDITSSSDEIDLEKVILTQMGNVQGVVNCDQLIQGLGVSNRPENYIIRIPEIGKSYLLDDNGTFSINALPQGTYTIQVEARTLAIEPYYSAALFDTLITVDVGKTTIIPPIELRSESSIVDDSIYSIDTVVVREILDDNGDTSGVRNHIRHKRSRVVHLQLRNISILPPIIEKLNALEQFVVFGGNLTELPPEIGNCESLQKITITDTELKSLPIEITLLEDLTMLDLRYNKFDNIPEALMDIPWIPVLHLENNYIHATDEERSWLLSYRFANDSLELFDWENSQLTKTNARTQK